MSNGSLNLAPQRGPSVWDQPSPRPPRRRISFEPWLLPAAGTLLFAWSLGARPRAVKVMAAAAAAASWVAAARRIDLGAARAWIERLRRGEGLDYVGDTSDSSFPASDAPAWTATGTGTRPR